MIPIAKINKLELIPVIKLLNESGLLKEVIQVIGHTKLDLIKAFSYEVEHLPEENQERLPELVQEMYNYIYQDEDVKGRTFKVKNLKKVSEWGAAEGTQSYILDEMFTTGGFTIEEMARACCTNKHRVRRHITTRKRQFNFHFIVNDGKYYMKPNDEETDGFQKNKRVVRGFDL
jgi:hypothetical protein